MIPAPDWDRITADVTMRIRLLAAAWAESESRGELHAEFVRDLYKPTMAHLARFCAAVEVGDE